MISVTYTLQAMLNVGVIQLLCKIHWSFLLVLLSVQCALIVNSYIIYFYLLRLYSTSAEGLQDTRPYSLLKMVSQDSMFEKLQTGEKIHDAPRQPRTCSHPIYARTLTGVCQAIRIFSPCFKICCKTKITSLILEIWYI